MNFDSNTIQYLNGSTFSNDLKVKFSQTSLQYDRTQYLVEAVAGKSVLHIGCVDHLPLVENKIRHGKWLHQNLQNSAKFCVGIDINKEGIDWLTTKGIQDLYYCDILNSQLPNSIANVHFDIVILGEMIEHVNSPIDFLRQLHLQLHGRASVLLTTTPNAFRIQNLIGCFKNQENINTDHRFWFTPFTLAKNLVVAGFMPIEVRTIWNFFEGHRIKRLLKTAIGTFFPIVQDCLIAKARF